MREVILIAVAFGILSIVVGLISDILIRANRGSVARKLKTIGLDLALISVVLIVAAGTIWIISILNIP